MPVRFCSSSILVMILCAGLSITLITGCEQMPGDGGTSELQGKVFVNEYNASGTLFNSYYGPDERVYIIYGDGTTYDDEVRTSYDGSYKFTFLRKGTYKIFTYSDCITCDGGVQAIIEEVEINDNHSTVTVPDLVIDKR